MSKAPKKYHEFIERFPELGEAWNKITEAGSKGKLDAKTCRLIKLAIALGAQKQSPASASVRKALDLGITLEELEQVVALAASTIGLPGTVASWSWVTEAYEKAKSK
jgi:alkylhydroperoxidase/carboxymuconolactone decarboxylase family protein YurZ